MIIISDLHLTDHEADEYRWKIFPWLEKYYEEEHDKNLLILGDLTDSKDHHSAELVNNIVQHLLTLRDAGMEIFVLKGNHDYINPDLPYFGFLDEFSYIKYITDPKACLIQGLQCLFLPHTRNPIDDWKADKVVQKYKDTAALVFMHQSVIGSVTSNNYKMEEGLRQSYFKRFKGRVISGDIHVPQECGQVTYVGAPYSVRFNDHYDPRAIVISPAMDGDDIMYGNLSLDIPGRRTLDITSVYDIEAPKGFQVKVRVHMSETVTWPDVKEDVAAECKKQGLILSSLHLVKEGKLPLRKKVKEAETKKPGEIVQHYGKRRGLSIKSINTGRRIVDD